MGFFKSLREVSSVAKEIDRAAPPMADRMSGAMAAMQSSQALMANLTEASTVEAELRANGIRATATVASVGAGQAMVNMASVMTLDLLVQAPGRPPMPATVSAAVPQHLLHKVSAGSQVPVLMDPTGSRVALDTVALSAP
jgi:hypothetical protein